MKYSVARGHYNEFSGRASDVARQLAFAGIAAVWLFRPEKSQGVGLPDDLLPVALALALCLLCDLLQYVYAAAAWGVYQYWYESLARTETSNDEMEGEIPDSPGWINYATITLFILKLVFLTTAYVLFVMWLAGRV